MSGISDDRKCCDDMARQVEHVCEQHSVGDCPDQLVRYSARFDEYTLPIRDGGSSGVVIARCPWCGSNLPASKRDAWFDRLDELGLEPDAELPAELKSDAWWRAAVVGNLSLQRPAEEFATAARKLCDALENPPVNRNEAAMLLLRTLSTVYSKALALDWAGDDFAEPDLDEAFPVSDAERQRIVENVSKVFGERSIYWFQFDPVLPRDGAEAAVAGDLTDDFGDIYRDIVPALRAWEADADRFDDIIFEWRATTFETHWGVHASHALHALHKIVFDHGLVEPDE